MDDLLGTQWPSPLQNERHHSAVRSEQAGRGEMNTILPRALSRAAQVHLILLAATAGLPTSPALEHTSGSRVSSDKPPAPPNLLQRTTQGETQVNVAPVLQLAQLVFRHHRKLSDTPGAPGAPPPGDRQALPDVRLGWSIWEQLGECT